MMSPCPRKFSVLAYALHALLAVAVGLVAPPAAAGTAETAAIAGDVLFKRSLPEPLVAVGEAPTAEENAALQAVLAQYRQAGERENVSALVEYLDKHPDSLWCVALFTNLGLIYYDAAQFSNALAAFDDAWRAGKSVAADGPAKALVNRSLGEVVRMHARIGHKDDSSRRRQA